jgi:hypothetical protein
MNKTLSRVVLMMLIAGLLIGGTLLLTSCAGSNLPGGSDSGTSILDRDKQSPNENPSPGGQAVTDGLSDTALTWLVLGLFLVGGLMLGAAFLRARYKRRNR